VDHYAGGAGLNLQFRHKLREWCPPWLAKPFGVAEKLFWVLGACVDGTIEWFVQGAQARMPGQGTPTALGYIGRDRRIRRGFDESDASYAARLLTWRADHRLEGTPASLFSQLRGFLSPHNPVMRYVNRTGTSTVGWATIDSAGVFSYVPVALNWDWDTQLSLASRFWLVIYPPSQLWTDDGLWGDGDSYWGDEGTWGSTATTAQVETVRGIVKEWASAASICQEVIIAWSSGDFEPIDSSPPNPDGFWANYGKNVAGTEVPARITNAAYWPVG